MKRISVIMLTIVAAMMSVSCIDEISDSSAHMQELTFSASCQSETKTALTEENEVYWLPGDQIAVSGAADPFTTDIEEPSDFTRFTGSAAPASEYYAVYPYASVKSWDGSTTTVEIPQTQTAVKGTFADDLNISVASTSADDMLFRFHNVLGYVKFTVTENTGKVKSVVVKAIGGEPLAGYVSVDCSADFPSASALDSSVSSVTFSSETVLEPGNYYIALLPGTYSSGLEFTFTNEEGLVATKQIARELTLSACQIRNIGEMKGLEFENLTLDPTQIPDNEIWYRTTDGTPISLNTEVIGWPNSEFNTKVVLNTYQNGIGKIKFEQPLTEIKSVSFAQKMNLAAVYLPHTLNKLSGSSFVRCFELEEVFINSTSLSIISDSDYGESNPFAGCLKLKKFSGTFSSADERCIVIDNTIYSFAPYGLSEYSTPQGIEQIGDSAFTGHCLKILRVEEGVTHIGRHSFQGDPYEENTCLEYVYLPNSLKYVHGYAFIYNKNIKAFYGDNECVTDDNMALVSTDVYGDKWLISFASGSNLTEFIIPEGVKKIENYAFYHVNSLKTLHFPDSFEGLASGAAFEGTYNIERITGKYVLDDNRSMVIDSTLVMYAGAGQEKYITPKGVKSIGYQVLGFNSDIREYVISDDVTHVDFGYAFNNCPNLEIVTLSANMQYLGYDPFNAGAYCTPKIKTVYCRAIIPPTVYHNQSEYHFSDLTIYVPEESVNAYVSSEYWKPYRAWIKGYKYTDLPTLDYYISTDYFSDSKVTVLQKATQGNSIDIVLMGDAYSDREIADGSYAADMEYMYEKLFTEEPFKTHKNMFNVYYVNVVSMTEGYDYAGAALGGYFGNGTLVGGNDERCFEYALNAITEDEMDEALIIVAMNSDAYAGTCYMYYPESVTGTYGSGPAVAYFPKGGDAETFAQLLHHEACGHGFAKLADEYAYEDMGAVPSDYVSQIQAQQNDWGWWKNVDFTNDLSAIRWSNFINDTRYANEGLGAFEGGLTYWTGVWRPTENSIMRYNTGGFNAPSREAIYYRIHKLAYGDSWEYDYEDFVEYDAINRATSSSAPQKSRRNYVEKAFEPTAPPVIVGKSWRDALNK